MCGSCLCSGGSSGTGGVDCVLEDVSNTMLFSVVEFVWRLVVQFCLCRGVLVGLGASIVCWRMFLILCYFLLLCVYGSFVCSGGSSGTSGVDCVLEVVSNFMLFSVA